MMVIGKLVMAVEACTHALRPRDPQAKGSTDRYTCTERDREMMVDGHWTAGMTAGGVFIASQAIARTIYYTIIVVYTYVRIRTCAYSIDR